MTSQTVQLPIKYSILLYYKSTRGIWQNGNNSNVRKWEKGIVGIVFIISFMTCGDIEQSLIQSPKVKIKKKTGEEQTWTLLEVHVGSSAMRE